MWEVSVSPGGGGRGGDKSGTSGTTTLTDCVQEEGEYPKELSREGPKR